MTVRVLLFGPEAAKAGRDHAFVELAEDRTCRGVKDALERACPVLQTALASARIAANGRFVPPEHIVGEDDEIALIGMVSGG